ncbi:MAG: hypothetical protein M1823_000601 [Watsoniomyces obsoletus]|nr:MAG: hypothetical protein M1823_000601 [Watsoniomyces obsoletus]
MANSNAPRFEGGGDNNNDAEEVQSLLSTSTTSNTRPSSPKPQNLSVSGTPRTPQRVRFQLDDEVPMSSDQEAEDGIITPEWVDEEDYLASSSSMEANGSARRNIDDGHRVPLLTDIEAPSVALATPELDYDESDWLEVNRPKSGMRNAFMNMANSIIGAGIIGQPYAFKQAGLATGIILLIVLTITVDWTIRLIVINSKMSGANSFQGTMEACFGRPGLIAISIAQWVL